MKPRATDPLADLLKTTDSAFGPPPLPSDLAGTVRRRAKRRTRQRVAGISVVLVTSLGIAALLLRHPERPPVVVIRPPAPPPATDPRDLETRLRQLRAQADTQHATLERWRRSLETRRRLDHVHAALAAAAPSAEVISVERERAALILLDHADRLRRELKQEDAARAAYRRTMELFPDTRWAAVARQRMEQTPT